MGKTASGCGQGETPLTMLASFVSVATWAWSGPAGNGACPTVKTVGSNAFNLTEWVRKSWYIQEQQIVGYQPLDALHCVVATYNLEGAHVPFFRGTVATVYNYANLH